MVWTRPWPFPSAVAWQRAIPNRFSEGLSFHPRNPYVRARIEVRLRMIRYAASACWGPFLDDRDNESWFWIFVLTVIAVWAVAGFYVFSP